jgi:hypothetical protein
LLELSIKAETAYRSGQKQHNRGIVTSTNQRPMLRRHKPKKLAPIKHVALGLICILTTAMPAIAWEPGDDWRDDQCESEIDAADRVANVCRGVYGRGEVFLGIYWNDGAEVVGPCNATKSWPIEYRGLSRADARDWLVDYCGW